jgi:pilus assembly protein FimV
MTIRVFGVLSAILCLLASHGASGLALSEIELSSRLNQPLNARIRLVAISQAELDSLSVSVHGAAAGGEPTEALQQAIDQDENGHFIVITSREPVREPVMTLMLELSWSAGHLTRQYALIIDPS